MTILLALHLCGLYTVIVNACRLGEDIPGQYFLALDAKTQPRIFSRWLTFWMRINFITPCMSDRFGFCMCGPRPVVCNVHSLCLTKCTFHPFFVGFSSLGRVSTSDGALPMATVFCLKNAFCEGCTPSLDEHLSPPRSRPSKPDPHSSVVDANLHPGACVRDP